MCSIAEGSRQLSDSAAQAIAERLSALSDIRLPSQLTRENEVTVDEIQNYFLKLLSNDPGVFLERHGELLLGKERDAFECLRTDNYEVDFHLKRLEDGTENHIKKSKRVTQVKNRRFVAMQKLDSNTDFFSEDAIREREPYLHHLYLGQYGVEGECDEEGRGHTTRKDGNRDDATFAAQLVMQQEEMELLVRRKVERDRCADIERDQEEEDEEEIEDHGREERRGHGQHASLDDVQSLLPCQQHWQPRGVPEDVLVSSRTWASSEERISKEERRENLEALRDIMRQKFLAGEDLDTDYKAIDATEVVLEEERRDEEDAYFDAD